MTKIDKLEEVCFVCGETGREAYREAERKPGAVRQPQAIEPKERHTVNIELEILLVSSVWC